MQFLGRTFSLYFVFFVVVVVGDKWGGNTVDCCLSDTRTNSSPPYSTDCLVSKG